jgi:hypothetical protein
MSPAGGPQSDASGLINWVLLEGAHFATSASKLQASRKMKLRRYSAKSQIFIE